MKPLLLLLLATCLFTFAGCASRHDSSADADRIHGSVGARYQSQDTSRLDHGRAPY